MGWLAGFFALLLPTFLNWAWKKVSEVLGKWVAARARKSQIESEDKAAREKTEAAQAPKERDDALTNIANHF